VRLTKPQREALGAMFGGLCAYCGQPLGARWHADHVEAVQRKLVRDEETGRLSCSWSESWKPENDTLANRMPACPPCNIDKHTLSLEGWRRKLQDACNVLARNQPTYRHAMRFGLVVETGASVTFHFERVAAARMGRDGAASADPAVDSGREA
jgi:hypothetical protein